MEADKHGAGKQPPARKNSNQFQHQKPDDWNKTQEYKNSVVHQLIDLRSDWA